jgi:S1-C subfamily serine protease
MTNPPWPPPYPPGPPEDAGPFATDDPAGILGGQARPRRRVVGSILAIACLLLPGVVGYALGERGGDRAPTAAAPTVAEGPRTPAASTSELDALADRVDDVVVNVTTTVDGGGQAAGSGIVISSDGLILTNNHVISGSTALRIEFGTTGTVRTARLLGYSLVDDVAVLQIPNVSGLRAASLGSSASLRVGDTVLAIGNRGGRGGAPKIAVGTVAALQQEITASDPDGGNVQRLDGLIQLAAGIQSGDSGGAVVATDGRVVGMNVAASVTNSFGGGTRGVGEGYAIPIEDALRIAQKIVSGEGGPDIRVGATRAVLGVQVQSSLGGLSGTGGTGARIVGVDPGSGAAAAGLVAGDAITGLDGRTIGNGRDLVEALVNYGPGDTARITWRDASGRTRSASVRLGEGPPA